MEYYRKKSYFILLMIIAVCTLNAQSMQIASQFSSKKPEEMVIGLGFDSAILRGKLNLLQTDHFAVNSAGAEIRIDPFFSLALGQLQLSGIFSRLRQPVWTSNGSFHSIQVPKSVCAYQLPSMSSSPKTAQNLLGQLTLGDAVFSAGMQLSESAQQAMFVCLEFPVFKQKTATAVKSKANQLDMLLFIGHFPLQAAEEKTWFRKTPYFAPQAVHFASTELSFSSTMLKVFSSLTCMEHPLGGLYFSSQNQLALDFDRFKLFAAIHLTDRYYYTITNNLINEPWQIYINPQIHFAGLKLGAFGRFFMEESLKLDAGAGLSWTIFAVQLNFDYALQKLICKDQVYFNSNTTHKIKSDIVWSPVWNKTRYRFALDTSINLEPYKKNKTEDYSFKFSAGIPVHKSVRTAFSAQANFSGSGKTGLTVETGADIYISENNHRSTAHFTGGYQKKDFAKEEYCFYVTAGLSLVLKQGQRTNK